MLTVMQQNDIIKNIVGMQSIAYDKSYRMNKFCLKTNKEDKHLLYNNLTKELLLLSQEEISSIKTANYNINNPIVEELIKKWFLVPIDFDEKILSAQICNIAKIIAPKLGVTFYNIFTTTACNARCFYCFEAGAKTRTMAPETADAVADYIIKNSNGNKITLQWFGGEPLCNFRAIDIICKKLLDKKIDFESVIITNGYLFDDTLITKAIDVWNTKYIQITLDGMSETYNRVKNYKNAVANPFEKVINNIAALLEKGAFLSVRMNMDEYNKNDLYLLSNFLADKFGYNDHFEVNVSLIFEDVGFVPTSRSGAEREKLFNDYFALRSHQESLGILRKRFLKNNIRIGRCAADSPNAVQIMPGGELGNCEHYPDKYFYGSVFEETPRHLWTDYAERLDICNDCADYPTCFILKRCNTKQCSPFRKKVRLAEMERNVIFTYEKLSKKMNIK